MAQIAPKALPTNPRYDRDKLKAAILYFLKRANNDHLGKTKLMKLLYYADFDHAERFGVPITGARYRKLPQGPVPMEAMQLLDELIAQHPHGAVKPEQRSSGPYVQNRYEALEEPDLDVFSESERLVLEQVVTRWEYEPLNAIVAATHAEAPWLAVSMNEMIPYHLASYRSSLSGSW